MKGLTDRRREGSFVLESTGEKAFKKRRESIHGNSCKQCGSLRTETCEPRPFYLFKNITY